MKKIIKMNFQGLLGIKTFQSFLKMSLGLFLFFSVSSLSAQSNIDFVGNETLKAGEKAVYVFKDAYRTFQTQVTTVTVSDRMPVTMEELFYTKTIDVIMVNDEKTKTAVNLTANALVDKGYAEQDVANLVNLILPKLRA